jgi:hypothetical protein
MGRDTLKVVIDIEMLNNFLTWAYDLGRENENREERGIPLLNEKEELRNMLKKYLTNNEK